MNQAHERFWPWPIQGARIGVRRLRLSPYNLFELLMSLSVAPTLVLLGASATFLAGLSGILYRSPTRLADELGMYCVVSGFTLIPFAILWSFLNNERYSRGLIAFGALAMGAIGVFIHLGEMLSKEASWGFSFILVPALQFGCFIVVWALLSLSSE